MKFSYKDVPFSNKEIMREQLLNAFGRDISEVECNFSSRNYAFMFTKGPQPAALRVSGAIQVKDKENILSELVWLDDLREFIPTVSAPVPSKNNRLVEEITVGGKIYYATLFRKGNGDVMPIELWDGPYFKRVGRLLGKIHKASSEGYKLGFRYKRNIWFDSPYYDFECYGKFVDPSVKTKAKEILDRIKEIPKDPQWFGMIHGDFQYGNLFSDWEDVWVFDFDDCCYGYFMFDIATAAHLFLSISHYKPELSAYEKAYGKEGVLTCLRAGYEEYWQLPEKQWELLGDFLRLRVCEIASIMIMSNTWDKELLSIMVKSDGEFITSSDDAIECLDAISKEKTARIPKEKLMKLKKRLSD